MWEYKIYKNSLGYGIYRKKTVGKIMLLYYLNGNDQRVSDKGSAKTFYSQDSAISALVIIKAKGETPTTSTKKSESEERKEKTSWSELG